MPFYRAAGANSKAMQGKSQHHAPEQRRRQHRRQQQGETRKQRPWIPPPDRYVELEEESPGVSSSKGKANTQSEAMTTASTAVDPKYFRPEYLRQMHAKATARRQLAPVMVRRGMSSSSSSSGSCAGSSQSSVHLESCDNGGGIGTGPVRLGGQQLRHKERQRRQELADVIQAGRAEETAKSKSHQWVMTGGGKIKRESLQSSSLSSGTHL